MRSRSFSPALANYSNPPSTPRYFIHTFLKFTHCMVLFYHDILLFDKYSTSIKAVDKYLRKFSISELCVDAFINELFNHYYPLVVWFKKPHLKNWKCNVYDERV